MDNTERLMKLILMICEALVSITEFECCTYGFNAERRTYGTKKRLL